MLDLARFAVDNSMDISFIEEMPLGEISSHKRSNTQITSAQIRQQLEAEFKPIAKNAIEKVHVTQYWDDAAKVYNQIPFVQKVNPDVDDYVTHQAINGLFKLVALEEKEIRDDPAARISDILVRVFGYTKP